MCCTWYGRPPAQAVKGIHRLTGPHTNLPPRMIAGFCGMIRQLTPFSAPLPSSLHLSLQEHQWMVNFITWGTLDPQGAFTPLVQQADQHANGTDVSAESLSCNIVQHHTKQQTSKGDMDTYKVGFVYFGVCQCFKVEVFTGPLGSL